MKPSNVLDLQAAREKREGWEVLDVTPEIQVIPLSATRYEVRWTDGEEVRTLRVGEAWVVQQASRMLRAVAENAHRDGPAAPEAATGKAMLRLLTDGTADGVKQ